MIALKILDIKDFMSRLLKGEAFDPFWLVEASITTYNTFTIDGSLHRDFFDAPLLEALDVLAVFPQRTAGGIQRGRGAHRSQCVQREPGGIPGPVWAGLRTAFFAGTILFESWFCYNIHIGSVWPLGRPIVEHTAGRRGRRRR